MAFGADAPPVVLADNDRLARAELARSLQKLGLRVTVCAHLKEMFAALKPLKEALLFIDLHIDDTDCLELLPKIIEKSRQVGRKYVILAMSDFGGANIALSVTKAGAFRYLKKPVLDEILSASVAEAIEELGHLGERHEVERFVPPRAQARAGDVAAGEERGVRSDSLDAGDAAVQQGATTAGAGNVLRRQGSSDEAGGAEGRAATGARGRAAATPATAPVVSEADLGEPDELTGGRLYAMDRMTVLRVAPDEPGVITFFDSGKEPLLLEWASNLNQRLCYYVDLHPASSEIARTARYFEIVATMDRREEAKIFDRLVNKTGRFPSLMKEAPEGSRHSNPSLSPDGRDDEARITGYERTSDPDLIAKIRRVMAENPQDPLVQDWLAFTLYSNNMLEEAIDWYTKLITGGSRKEEHFFYCANAFYKRGDKDRAMKMWKVAMSLNPKSTIARKSAKRLDAALVGRDPEMTTF